MANGNVNLSLAFGLPPEKAVAYFRAKGYAITFDWHEMADSAHAAAFTVAKAARIDILQDIRAAVDSAAANGDTLATFKKQLAPVLKAKGWWGRQTMPDAAGQDRTVQLGSGWRLGTIYRANLSSAYAAGRYQQQMDNADDRPYWQYVAIMDARTRPEHAALNDLVFRYDDPFWATHYPPLGFNCRCRVRALTGGQITRKGLEVQDSSGRMEWKPVEVANGVTKDVAGYHDPDTGKTVWTDPGWSSNPGQVSLDRFLYEKAQALYEGCGPGNFANSGFPCGGARKVFSDVLDGYQKSFNPSVYHDFVKNVLENQRYPQNQVVAGYIDLPVYDAATGFGVTPKTPEIWFRKNELMHSRHNLRADKSGTVAISEIYDVPRIIALGKAYWDSDNNAVAYVADAMDGSNTKIIVRVDYSKGGVRGNYIVTIDKVAPGSMASRQYMEIER